MSLDLTALSSQVRDMSKNVAQQASVIEAHIQQMHEMYLAQAGHEAYWAEVVEQKRAAAPWRVLARPTQERFDFVREVPPVPHSYAVVATDGSQIEADRHGFATYYLINIGQVYLRYGTEPAATLSSQPKLSYREEDLYISDASGQRKIPIEGACLNTCRDIQELVRLNALGKEFLAPDQYAVMLVDGTLLRWVLVGFEQFAKDFLLNQYLHCLGDMRERGIPVASYISRPRASEVVNTIALMYSNGQNGDNGTYEHTDDQQADEPAPTPNGQTWQNGTGERLRDADVFGSLLTEGQRGPLFVSLSRINVESYGEHLVHFFYMRVGRELARVEVPCWVADEPHLVDQVHGLVYDQCLRGQGYPVALARAHEQAVVRGGDRRAFRRMVEGSFVRAELAKTLSMKQENKEMSKV
jgi:hypothetical protein